MALKMDPSSIGGLNDQERRQLGELLKVYHSHLSKNTEKNKYYEGKISLGEVNLGIALPQGMRGLEIGCSWGAKCVDVLAARSMFDGFVGVQGEPVEALERIVAANHLVGDAGRAEARLRLRDAQRGSGDRLQDPLSFATDRSGPVERREGPDRLRLRHHRHCPGRVQGRGVEPLDHQLLYRRRDYRPAQEREQLERRTLREQNGPPADGAADLERDE